MNAFSRLVSAGGLLLVIQGLIAAQDAESPYGNLVPQYLLGLVHAPEVHKELKLTDQQVDDLEALLRTVDARWFPARILPTDQQRAVIRELESQVWAWFDRAATDVQRQRLKQLECYAQGSRVLLRSDIAKRIDVQSAQQQKLALLARATDESNLALTNTQFGDPKIKGLQDRANKATRAEREGMAKIIRPEQWKTLKSLLGDPFDPTRLTRIYAMAPEFVPVENWINSSPMTMRELRGKVVLVHFYAFQCHNCHANFEIYRRWHKDLVAKGVVVVGIQTPETSRERDADAVKTAARERDLTFPIMIDLASENWKAWGNTMWPCVYVVDKHGYIRLWWPGELNWKGATGDKTIEKAVDKLLAED
ncbi:redoxin domain-containing protein [Schlesneria paludicola]|uniref:redoxin domain-containing protein n=1 Tax=Schlesneria paludicola TaxID=360056 RepID=UPI00029A6699|nr:redoxin domain-containing protein [Schlesneria paludicola]